MSTRKYLKDWRPAPFLIDAVDLTLDVGERETEVTSRLALRRNPDARRAEPLWLDGRQMALVSLRVDGQALEAGDYARSDEGISIRKLPDACELEIVTRIDPHANTSLEGWYAAGDMLCTQCEAHGFSRISYFPDRPDVLSRYRTTLIADPRRYPVLLSNGNPGPRRKRADGRVAVTWTDPHPKPCYLFAAVAGDLARRQTRYTTGSGRAVRIEFYTDHGIEDRVDHAMGALKRAMRWDEEHYGREYDLDRYLVVVAGAFNMGAMENKGLNIFNPRYVLATPQTATDADFHDVEAVVAHEYFHNWTGNRVTCRDWFQLSLKEGLTVFREQQFMATAGRGAVQRIDEVSFLRSIQFVEDAGPLSHPVRPDSYLEMNNFYTSTVYEKGAELVRILANRTGERGFRRGMDRYFRDNDGKAVTIEDFLAAHAGATGVDTAGILRWYGQAGTPVLEARDRQNRTGWQLSLRQRAPDGRAATSMKPVTIPVRLSALDARGRPVRLRKGHPHSIVVTLERRSQTFRFDGVEVAAPVLLEGFSAPVTLDYPYTREQLQLILAHAEDSFARWDAAQRLFRMDIEASESGAESDTDYDVFARLLEAKGDEATVATILTLPSLAELASYREALDFQSLQGALDAVEERLARALPDLGARIDALATGRWKLSDRALRDLRGRLLQLMMRTDPRGAARRAEVLYSKADNLSDRMHALTAINRSGGARRRKLLAEFARRYRDDRLAMNRWFSLQATVPERATVDVVSALLDDRRFDRADPNRVRALLGAFARMNPVALFRPDGRGVALLTRELLQFDRMNPQLASGLVQALAPWRRLQGPVRGRVQKALQRLARQAKSPDLKEQVERLLAD